MCQHTGRPMLNYRSNTSRLVSVFRFGLHRYSSSVLHLRRSAWTFNSAGFLRRLDLCIVLVRLRRQVCTRKVVKGPLPKTPATEQGDNADCVSFDLQRRFGSRIGVSSRSQYMAGQLSIPEQRLKYHFPILFEIEQSWARDEQDFINSRSTRNLVG